MPAVAPRRQCTPGLVRWAVHVTIPRFMKIRRALLSVTDKTISLEEFKKYVSEHQHHH